VTRVGASGPLRGAGRRCARCSICGVCGATTVTVPVVTGAVVCAATVVDKAATAAQVMILNEALLLIFRYYTYQSLAFVMVTGTRLSVRRCDPKLIGGN